MPWTEKMIQSKQEFCENAETKQLQLRNTVSELFRQKGYEGEYPDFHKRVWTRGFTLRESHGAPYLIFPLQRAFVTAHCESVTDGQKDGLQVCFGTDRSGAASTPDQCREDSCGRRLYCETVLWAEAPEDDWDTGFQKAARNPEQLLWAAMKEAELKSLSREDRKALCQPRRGSVGTYLAFLFFWGLLISVPLTPLGMLLLSLLRRLPLSGGFQREIRGISWNTVQLVTVALTMLAGVVKAAVIPRKREPKQRNKSDKNL